MDDLLGEFVAETREMLEAIGGELVAWEAAPDDRARLDAVFRFVHTVKGNCGFFDFPRLERLSHAAEDALSEVRAGRRAASPRLVTAVLAIVDRIGAMIDAIEAGDELPEHGDDMLIAALEANDDDTLEKVASLPSDEDSAKAAPGQASTIQRSIRLPVPLLDNVMSSVSDLVLARNELARRMRDAAVDPVVQGPFERLGTILDQLREAVTRMRMQRIENLYGALPRLVRDLSTELGKQVMVDLEGGDVELDREMIEMVRDPLTHIIRNAIDHGIEAPAARLAAGKREIGLLHIGARQSGNRIILAVSDDGRGIDCARLAAQALAAGILKDGEAEELSEGELHALIFEPGLSTAGAVTAVSGRGVGMDVVRANIERVGGSIEVTSVPGEGTRVVLSLPLTLSIIPSLTIGAGGQMFAMPRSYVEEIVHGRAAHLEYARAGDSLLVTVRGRRLACISLAAMLGMGDPLAPEKSVLVLVRLAGGDLFALAVDKIFDHEELVIKPLAPAIMATGFYAGTTLLDDGNPILMLDVAGIARKARLIGDVQKRARATADEQEQAVVETGAKALLLVGLDGRRRVVRLGAIERIERIDAAALDLTGDRPRVVVGDRLIALAGAEGGAPAGDQVNLLRMTDGLSEVAYAFDRVIDTFELTRDIEPAAKPGPSEGTVLVAGAAAEVIDTHWLFATHAAPARAVVPLVCRLRSEDAWAQTFLAPLIESAGYAIVDEHFPGRADVAIESDDEAAEPRGDAAEVITLSADPDCPTNGPRRLYRYDRAGLLSALAALRAGRAA